MRDTTRRCLDALLVSAADNAENVREHVVKSIISLGSKGPLEVLQHCEQWLSSHKHSSTADIQRQLIIKAMIGSLKHCVGVTIPPSQRDALLTLSVSEMTAVIDLNSGWAREACTLCVELMSMFPKEGCVMLINPLNSQTLPHFFITESLARFADQYPLSFLPYLKEAISKLLPIMSLAKQDNHCMLISKALGTFGDAVLRVQNMSTGELTLCSKEASNFSRADSADTMYSGIQFLLGDWTRISEQRVRLQVYFALGAMFANCSDDNRIQLIPKVLPLMLAALKKDKPQDQIPISRGFSDMLMFCNDNVAQTLAPHMDNITHQLLNCIIASSYIAGKDAQAAKNLEYLLLAMEHIAEFHMDGLIVFIGKVLDAKSNNKDPGMRAACLYIFRHLISRKSLEPRLKPFQNNIIATVKLSLVDGDWRVRKALAQTIIAMGSSEIDFFTAIGGSDLLTFVINNGAISNATVAEFAKKEPNSSASPGEVRDICLNTLTVFSAMQGKLDTSLWPFLFEHMGNYHDAPHLVNIFPSICRCLVQIGNRVSHTDYYYVDFNSSVNVPKPPSLAAKFLVQSTQFETYSQEELHSVLESMSMVAPLLDEPFLHQDKEEIPTPIGSLWLGTVPELQKLLMQGDINKDDWEDYMCRLITKTMTAPESETYIEELTTVALNDLCVYQNYPNMFRSCLIIIGIGLGRCSKREFVSKTIEMIVDLSNHENAEHRIGLAKAFGFICIQHPDAAMEKLGLLAKGPEKRGLFDRKDPNKKVLTENSRIIAALGLAYGARKMPQNVLASRLDASVIPILTALLGDGKGPEVRENILEAIQLLEAPIKKFGSYNFRGRDSLIEAVLHAVPCDPATKAPSSSGLLKHVLLAMKAIGSTIRSATAPPVATGVQEKITGFAIHFVQRQWTEITLEKDVEATMTVVDALQMMMKHNEKMSLDVIIQPFLKFFTAANTGERLRAVLLATHLTKCATERTQELLSNGVSSACTAATIGVLLGAFLPRFMDTVPLVRSAAADGVIVSFFLTSLLHPDMMQDNGADINTVNEEVAVLKGRTAALTKDGTAASEKEVTNLTKSLCTQVVTLVTDPKHFIPLLDSLLIAGLRDPQDDAASCSCVVMHGMIRGLGQKLPEEQVKKILEQLISAIDKVGNRDQSLNGILVSIRNLSKHHNILCFNGILKYPTPHNDNVIKAFHAISSDTALSPVLLQHCLDVIINSQLVEDVVDKDKSVKGLAHLPLSSACALGWICQTSKGAEAAAQIRGAVFCTLSLYLTIAFEINVPAKAMLVSRSLRHYLETTCAEVTLDRIERVGWENLNEKSKYLNTLLEITKFLCREELGDTNETDRDVKRLETGGLDVPPSEPTALAIEIAQFILPYMNKPIRSHRRTAISLSAALLRHCINEKRLLQSLVTGLLGRCGSDESPELRAEALLAFKNIIAHPYKDMQVYISPIVSAMLSNFGDKDEAVAQATMLSTYHIITTIAEKTQIAPIIVNIILKTKTLFESPDVFLRREAFRLFGYIVTMTNAGEMDNITMSEQIYLHLVTFLVHCQDDVPEVQQTVKAAVQEIGKFLQSDLKDENGKDALAALFGKHMQPTKITQMDEFYDDFCAAWVQYFPSRINDLLVSLISFIAREKDCIRTPAVVACGYVLKHMPTEDMGRANIDQTCNSLMAHVNPSREKNPSIRAHAAKALGMLNIQDMAENNNLWQIQCHVATLSGKVEYLRGRCESPVTDKKLLLLCQQGTSDKLSVEKSTVANWDDADDDTTAEPETTMTTAMSSSQPSTSSSPTIIDSVVIWNYYILYSDIYCTPEIYFTVEFMSQQQTQQQKLKQNASLSYFTRSIYNIEEVNELLGFTAETSNIPIATRPVISLSFCDQLQCNMMSLHQCDMSTMLKCCQDCNVGDFNNVRNLIRLLGPLIGMTPKLLR